MPFDVPATIKVPLLPHPVIRVGGGGIEGGGIHRKLCLEALDDLNAREAIVAIQVHHPKPPLRVRTHVRHLHHARHRSAREWAHPAARCKPLARGRKVEEVLRDALAIGADEHADRARAERFEADGALGLHLSLRAGRRLYHVATGLRAVPHGLRLGRSRSRRGRRGLRLHWQPHRHRRWWRWRWRWRWRGDRGRHCHWDRIYLHKKCRARWHPVGNLDVILSVGVLHAQQLAGRHARWHLDAHAHFPRRCARIQHWLEVPPRPRTHRHGMQANVSSESDMYIGTSSTGQFGTSVVR